MACVKASLRSPYVFGSQRGSSMMIQEDPGVSQMGPDLARQLLPSSWEMWHWGDEVAAEKKAIWLWIWSVLYLSPKIG